MLAIRWTMIETAWTCKGLVAQRNDDNRAAGYATEPYSSRMGGSVRVSRIRRNRKKADER
ncbi:MAG: hypothetical protein A4E67_02415 [Syntrophaceae bacterium PtaB.Bin038]|nr:MAG: hypothetical protein A4E67_02415 [Syntrophaceae bacterium PtaB.Bin038]